MGAAHSYLEFPRRRNRIPCDHPEPSTAGLISHGQVPHAPTGSAGDDVRRRHAQKVEEGAVNVTLRTVELLAEAFGVDVADMFRR
jgi:hypothetical protein